MRFIERYIPIPEGKDAGKPIFLTETMEVFFYSVFDNENHTRRAILSMARKNAKTTNMACILLCFLIGPEARLNTQIVSGAMSRDQASIIFKLAVKMIQLSKDLSRLVKIIPSKKQLIGLAMNVEFTALAADGATAQGLSVYAGFIDECGQVKGPSSDFISAIETSQGAHENPILFYLSTQAPTDADFLSVMIDDAENSQDPHTVCHLYAAPDECELMDVEAWAMANPGLGLFRSQKDLEEQMKEAERIPSKEPSARNLLLNQRVNMEAPFVSRAIWEQNGENPDTSTGKKVFGGLDLSAVADLTALVFVTDDGDVISRFWLPKEGLRDKARSDRVPYDVWEKQGHISTTPGRSIEYEYIAYELKRIFDEYDVQQINFDRFAIKFLIPWLKKAGLTEKQIEKFKELGQGFVSMGSAIRELESRLLQGKLKHGMNPPLTMCIGNCRVEMDAAGNRKFTKKKSTGRIDGAVALAMAVDALARYEENNKKEWSLHFI